MPVEMRKGLKWGALECTYDGPVEVTEKEKGVSYTRKVWSYVFQCECGNKIKVPRSQFAGRRIVRDCGCGLGLHSKHGMVTISVPVGLNTAIREIADKEHTSYSQVWARLARWGLQQYQVQVEAQEKQEREAKNGQATGTYDVWDDPKYR